MTDVPHDALLLEVEAPKPWPQWGWWDVAVTFCIFAASSLIVIVLGVPLIGKAPSFVGMSSLEIAKQPLFFVPAQLLSYVLAFILIRMFITIRAEEDFWTALQWRAPNA